MKEPANRGLFLFGSFFPYAKDELVMNELVTRFIGIFMVWFRVASTSRTLRRGNMTLSPAFLRSMADVAHLLLIWQRYYILTAGTNLLESSGKP